MDFNAFNAPTTTKTNNTNTNISIESDSLDFGGFLSGTGQTTVQPKF